LGFEFKPSGPGRDEEEEAGEKGPEREEEEAWFWREEG
jgi:hypothetical protein